MLRIEKLAQSHGCTGFNCGSDPLDNYLKRFALNNQRAGAAQTYLAFVEQSLVGYYSLTASEVACENAPERMKKGLARHPVPVLLLARLAVDLGWQGQGIGSGLLKDAGKNTIAASEIIGVRALFVHAKDQAACDFYLSKGFHLSSDNPLHLYALVKELR